MNAQTTDGDKLTDDYIEAAERQPRKNRALSHGVLRTGDLVNLSVR